MSGGPPAGGAKPGDDRVVLLDGPIGTELERRGFALPAPLWSARAVFEAPELLARIHHDYAAAGADVHTAATFRTTRRALRGSVWEARWAELAARAVALARAAARTVAGGRVAGSLAPLEDCFSPQLTPDDATLAREHAELAAALAQAGCDLLLVETMPTLRELRAATRAAVATGIPTWAAVTLGPQGDYFDPAALIAARHVAREEGAEAFLLNCTPADAITRAIAGAFPAGACLPDLAFGAYGNDLFAGGRGWSPARYADEARLWLAAGARIVGGCCGTGPEHLGEIARRRAGTGGQGSG